MPNVGYFNGRFLDLETPVLSLEERGALFGDGVYEVVRVYDGRPFLFEEHWARFRRSAEAVRLSVPHTFEEWSAVVAEALEKSTFPDATVYFQLTRGAGPRQHAFPKGAPHMMLTVRAASRISAAQRERGYTLCSLPDDRWANVHIKSLNLLPNVLAKQTALDQGCDEALYIRDGLVMEGSSSNVFFVLNDTLTTPPADRHILNGVTRQAVLALARKAGLAVKERPVMWQEALRAQEAFLTSTSLEIMPVYQIDGHFLPVVAPSVTARLSHDFATLVGKNL